MQGQDKIERFLFKKPRKFINFLESLGIIIKQHKFESEKSQEKNIPL